MGNHGRPLMCGVVGCHEGMFASVEEVIAHERTHVLAEQGDCAEGCTEHRTCRDETPSPRRNARRGDRVGTQLRFNPDLHARLTFAAEERGLALNFLVERLLTEALDDLIPASEFRLTKRPTVPQTGGPHG